MAYEDERMSIFFRISRLETIVGDLQKEHDLGKCTNQPLKELIELRKLYKELKAENKKLNEMVQGLEHELDAAKDARPEPCKKFRDASRKEWIAKLNEEVSEVIESLCSPAISREDRLREMVDVATVARSMAYAAGYTLDEWEEMQRWVNGNNRQRGYMDEPER